MDWRTTHRIVCMDDAGNRITVLKLRADAPFEGPPTRYVLGNGQAVRIIPDSAFQVCATASVLRPMNT